MSVMIVDPCCYTREGISGYLKHKKGAKRMIIDASSLKILASLFYQTAPRLVIVNDHTFYEEGFCFDGLKRLIADNRTVLFVIFVASFYIRYQELVQLDSNVLICSKEIDTSTLSALLSPNFFNTKVANEVCKFIPSQAERNLLGLWMAGMDTPRITRSLNICAKTVSSHKGNIKKKLKTHNMQIIFNIMRLSQILLLPQQANRPSWR
ncbi:LuxR C-terminal-related transcriptional regulator [Cedecea sp.]|jgi:LuxR family capsular biosynthesis transcriptional activator|uniref:LuxR C-terminal-related transcriptional regulator n=1 Tax=Cedecea sp. TaxID=1970739 RepID=UPI002F407CF9